MASRKASKKPAENLREKQAAAAYIGFHENGDPYLKGAQCSKCGEVYLGERSHCAHCTARDSMDAIALSNTGTLYNYTIVYRSYPDITVPFVSAVVDLQGGGTVKGNLIDIEATPENVTFGMPLEVVFRGAELANPAGEGFVSHFFIPAQN